MISYDGLYEKLRQVGITKTDLTGIGISSRTIAKDFHVRRCLKSPTILIVMWILYAVKFPQTQSCKFFEMRKTLKFQAVFITNFKF